MGRYHRFRYARLHQIEVFDRVDKCSLIVNNETWDSFRKIMHENEGNRTTTQTENRWLNINQSAVIMAGS